MDLGTRVKIRAILLGLSAFAAAVAAPSSAWAGVGTPRIESGEAGGIRWQVQSALVGQTSTLPGSLDPVYAPRRPQMDGVGWILGGGGLCSGSVLRGGRAMLTAAHCLSDRSGNPIVGGLQEVLFYNGPGDALDNLQAAETRTFSSFHLAPGYTGRIVDHNDLAIVMLD